MVRVYLITCSDGGYYEGKKDFTGPAVEKLVTEHGWSVAGTEVLPDERQIIAGTLRRLADKKMADLVLTLGGTGLNPRDVTPEATKDVIEKEVPGLGELMRMKSFAITPNGIMSRATAGIRGRMLIVNLPGSPRGATENLTFIFEALAHGMKMLLHDHNDCAHMDALRE